MTHKINAFAALIFLGILSGGVLVRFVAEGLRGNGSLSLTVFTLLMTALVAYCSASLVCLVKAVRETKNPRGGRMEVSHG